MDKDLGVTIKGCAIFMSLQVSIILATFNDSTFLREAVDSILSQTLTNYEFIIINDASTDSTNDILKSYKDPRIICLNNQTNLKLAASLNHGLEIARGKYVARMDGDDISIPERLEKQVAFMEAHPDVMILGTQWHHIDSNGTILGYSNHPLTHGLIMWTYLSRLAYPLTHPTIIMRRDFVESIGGYNTDFTREQDGELFLRAIDHAKYANLPDVLYAKRTVRSGKSASNVFSIGYKSTLKIRQECISRLLKREISVEDLKTIIYPTSRRHRQPLAIQPSFESVTQGITLLLEIFSAMDEAKCFTDEERTIAQSEIGSLISNMLRYCPEFVYTACDATSLYDMMRYLSQRIVKNLLVRLKID